MNDDEAEYYFELMVTINFVLTTLFFPLILFLMFKRSTQMNRYKYFLINSVFWNYCMELAMFLLKPRILVEKSCIGFRPFFSVSQQTTWYLSYLVSFILFNMNIGIAFWLSTG